MRILPPEIAVDESEGFAPDKDIFKRAAFGDGLTTLLRDIEHPLVLALDGAWGTGKTTFVRMWAGALRREGFPVIYFDAFANDHFPDAFIALAGEIAVLARKSSAKKAPYKKYLKAAKAVGKTLFVSGAKIAVKAGTMGALELADIQSLANVTDDIASTSSDLVEEYIQKRLETRELEHSAFAQFRASLSELAESLGKRRSDEGKEGQTASVLPLVFIVDELDRCRPPFALEILEKMKHFFSVEKVHFVLVTHMQQLENSIRYSYGPDIDARTYLQKFYHVAVHLPRTLPEARSTLATAFMNYFNGWLPDDLQAGQYTRDAMQEIERVSNRKDFSLRTLERIMSIFSLSLLQASKGGFRISIIVADLCIMRVDQPHLFAKAKAGNLLFDDVESYLGLAQSDVANSRFENLRNFWRFFSLPQLPADTNWNPYSSSLFHYNIDRENVVRWLANNVIDRFTVAN